MTCPHCGYANRDGAKFCKQCGAALVIVQSPPADAPSTLLIDDTQPSRRAVSAIEAAVSNEAAALEADTLPQLPAEATVHDEVTEQMIEAAHAVPAVIQPLAALSLPTTLVGRYELIDIIEQTDQQIVYRAYDHQACGQCGAFRSDLSDEYCWQCGAEIGPGAARRIQAGNLPADAPLENLLTEKEVTYWITPEPIAPMPQTPARKGILLRVGYASHPGMVREVDEDSLLIVTGLGMVEGAVQPGVGVFAVADGMGGHDNGQVASRRVIQVLAEELIPGLLSPALSGEKILDETPEEKVRNAVIEANTRLTTEARMANNDMGSTVTLAFVHDDTALIANVGDSRTYVWHGGMLQQITKDHSMVARLVEKGMIQPDEIYTHPRRSEIYRVMGDKPELEVDLFRCNLQTGDRLVLCCDGVWEMIRSEGIEEVLLTYPDDPQAACDEIVKRSNTAGGDDNISVIVVDVY